MREYTVEDINRPFQEVVKVKANSPLEAARKAYPDREVTRDYENTGNIIVGGWNTTPYCKIYKRYVYKLI